VTRILITSGPTRQYLDPVRYLTNASSGRMGDALARAVLALGHEVVIVSGPVEVKYPEAARVHWIVSTDELLEVSRREFQHCQGVIGAAAPCDYQPQRVSETKISKTGGPLVLELIETPDVMATLGAEKRADQWAVGFALETDDQRFKALTKLIKKSCDLMVLNGPQAMNSLENQVEIMDSSGEVLKSFAGTKEWVGQEILNVIQERLIRSKS
jgi:phosphopantothenoylcysteine decarboxylase/phosphopantothenate--cysteine ligase